MMGTRAKKDRRKNKRVGNLGPSDPRQKLAEEVHRFDDRNRKVHTKIMDGTTNIERVGELIDLVYQQVAKDDFGEFGEVVEIPFACLLAADILIPVAAMLTTSHGYERYRTYIQNWSREDYFEASFFLTKHSHYSGAPQVEVRINDQLCDVWDQSKLFDPDRNAARWTEEAQKFEASILEFIPLQRAEFIAQKKAELGMAKVSSSTDGGC